MNPYPFMDQPFFASPEEAALYFNSMRQYEPAQDPGFGGQGYPFMGAPMDYPFYQPVLPVHKPDTALDGPTTDKEPTQVKVEVPEAPMPVKFKKAPPLSPSPSDSASNFSDVLVKPHENKQPKVSKCSRKRKSNPKKNTQCNIINNVLSYLSCSIKSHSEISKLLSTPQQRNIFYIFLRNLRKTTPKYINRSSLKAITELEPNETQQRTLRKSARRLQVLPIEKLRLIIRKLIFSYMRGPACLLPLLTSNKIKTEARFDHLHRRWELIDFIENSLVDFNLGRARPVEDQAPPVELPAMSPEPLVLPAANFESNPFQA